MSIVSVLAFAFVAAVPQDTTPLVITGGTVIDVREYGTSKRDMRDAVVVIERGRITSVGPRKSIRVPARARTIDARGRYIVPGYIDGFAAQPNQAFANAHLYMGVTSVVTGLPGRSDARRGATFASATPSPRLFFLSSVPGAVREADTLRVMTDSDAVARLEGEVRAGAQVMLLHYFLTPSAVRATAARARELGVATIGEFGSTSYYEGQAAGVDAFVHTSRYSLDVASPPVRARVAARPFGPPRLEYYRHLIALPAGDTSVARHAKRLAAGSTMLMPTLSLFYLQLADHANPWREPVAAIIDPATIHLPADRETGMPATPPDTTRDGLPPGTADAMLRLERSYRAAGARYLTGSGVAAFGTMPGISLHTELELLVRIGLTPREALAAATWNFSRLKPWSSSGEVAPGRVADLLVLDADPTMDIRNAKRIHTIILDGSVIDRGKLLSLR